jgi:methyl-accepting chemotaxis protein
MQNMLRSLRIGQRLALGFGFVLALLAMLAGVATLRLQSAGESTRQLLDGEWSKAEAVATLTSTVQANAYATLQLLVADAGARAEVQRRLDGNRQRVDELLAKLDASLYLPEGKALLADLKDARGRYVEALQAVRREVDADQRDAAIERTRTEVIPRLDAVTAKAEALAALQSRLARDTGATVASDVAGGLALVWALSGLAALLGVASAWVITRSVTLPAAQALALVRRVAEGDLSQAPQAEGRDELSRLLQAQGEMVARLSGTVSGVRDGADSVATASAQIAQGNQDLSQRTEEQASALQQTAASMEQLGSTVGHNADNAGQANQLARQASAVASRGGEVVGRVVQTMQGIHQSSQRIADIIGVIDGIAFQTNILALNAAVEAARAGEQGRGFAVVAGEVRNLAQRSAEAAKEIKSLITASVEQVDTGSTLVNDAGATMTEVVQCIQRLSDIVGEIASASDEQRRGVSQIGEAVGQMDQVTQQNAALVEESAAAAESLKLQARDLLQAVSFFHVGGVPAQGLPKAATPAHAAHAPAVRSAGLPRKAGAAMPKAHPGAARADTNAWETF